MIECFLSRLSDQLLIFFISDSAAFIPKGTVHETTIHMKKYPAYSAYVVFDGSIKMWGILEDYGKSQELKTFHENKTIQLSKLSDQNYYVSLLFIYLINHSKLKISENHRELEKKENLN